ACGREVKFATTERYGRTVRSFGLEFCAIGDDSYLDDEASRRSFIGERGQENFWNLTNLIPLDDLCQKLAPVCVQASAILAPWFTLPAAIVAEFHGIPLTSVCFSAAEVTNDRTFGTGRAPEAALIARNRVNQVRRAFGLRALALPQLAGLRPAIRVIGLYPPVLDLARHPQLRPVEILGYPTVKHEQVSDLDIALQQWIAGGDFVLFTFGSHVDIDAQSFLDAATTACAALGLRGLYVSPFSSTRLDNRAAHMRIEGYAPHHLVMPRALAIVHHAGTGTLAAALEADRPMVVTPFAHDQPFNARRLQEMGLAELLAPADFTAARLEGALRVAISEHQMGEHAQSGRADGIGPHIADRVAAALLRESSPC
ncbi:MAG: putative glycosyl transferase, partial [Caulobacteraceae bacterium]|nr:putative glycosyl transferase [Caulobacteraceae bacterium]